MDPGLLSIASSWMAGMAVPFVGGYWIFDNVRGRLRNKRGQGASCSATYGEMSESYLVHGRMVCEGCAERLKRHTFVEISVLAVLVAVLCGLGIWAAISSGMLGESLFLSAFLIGPPLAMGAAFVGAMGLMKWQNRRALDRLNRDVLELPEEVG